MDLLKTGIFNLWFLDAKSNNPSTIVQREDGRMSSPKWAPDGKSTVYSAQVDGFQHLFLVPATGKEPMQLTAGKSNNIDLDIDITPRRHEAK